MNRSRSPRAPLRPPTLFSRLAYYLSSIPTLLLGIRNLPVLLRLLAGRPTPVLLALRDGTRFLVRSLMDVWIVKETCLDRQYERYGVPIADGWNVLDVGAGLGDFTVYAAKRSPHGAVHAYEPFPGSADLLARNLRLNGVENVTTWPHAVAGEAGTVVLDIDKDAAVLYSTIDRGSATGDGRLAVKGITLAEALEHLPGGRCDFVKMDCEGAEFGILLNLAEEHLDRIRHVCLEYHDAVQGSAHSHRDLVAYFEGRGWHTRLYPSPVHGGLGLLYAGNPGWARAT